MHGEMLLEFLGTNYGTCTQVRGVDRVCFACIELINDVEFDLLGGPSLPWTGDLNLPAILQASCPALSSVILGLLSSSLTCTLRGCCRRQSSRDVT